MSDRCDVVWIYLQANRVTDLSPYADMSQKLMLKYWLIVIQTEGSVM